MCLWSNLPGQFGLQPEKESLTSDEGAARKEGLERCVFILHFISLINRILLTSKSLSRREFGTATHLEQITVDRFLFTIWQ